MSERSLRWYYRNRDKELEKDRLEYALDPNKSKRKHDRWVKENPEKLFNYQLKTKYKISFERFHEILISQLGLCAACSKPMKNPYVDHDHSCCPKVECCGKCVRGLLCQHCNTALGYAKDSVKILQGLIRYLNEFKGISDVSYGNS